jgi:hypothetical protein
MIRFLQINLTKKQVTIPGGKKSELKNQHCINYEVTTETK